MNISKRVYVLSKDDIISMLNIAYKDGINHNSLEIDIIINEVMN
jgi:hypothetical protein